MHVQDVCKIYNSHRDSFQSFEILKNAQIHLLCDCFLYPVQESMKLMGLRTWVYWLSWFVKFLLLTLGSIIIITVTFHAPMSSNGPVIFSSAGTITFVLLVLYSMSLITFCFAISTCTKKGKI